MRVLVQPSRKIKRPFIFFVDPKFLKTNGKMDWVGVQKWYGIQPKLPTLSTGLSGEKHKWGRALGVEPDWSGAPVTKF